jgi:hypothetical protein
MHMADCKHPVQDYRASLPGKSAGQVCRASLPGKSAGQVCRASLPGKFSHDRKKMAVTGIYLLHKIWCNIQKKDHMIATLVPYHTNYFHDISSPAGLLSEHTC